MEVRSLHYSYYNRSALRGVNLGERRGVPRADGAQRVGKSTLLKQIVGLIKPGEGQVTVAGLDTRQGGVG